MAVLFGSEVVAEEIVAVLSSVPAVTTAVSAVVNLAVVPQGAALPIALTYMESGTYEGPIHYAATSERMRYVVRFISEGPSTDAIKAAAEGAFVMLDGHEADRGGASLVFQITGEWPLGTMLDDGVLYRQLGFYVVVDMTQGG